MILKSISDKFVLNRASSPIINFLHLGWSTCKWLLFLSCLTHYLWSSPISSNLRAIRLVNCTLARPLIISPSAFIDFLSFSALEPSPPLALVSHEFSFVKITIRVLHQSLTLLLIVKELAFILVSISMDKLPWTLLLVKMVDFSFIDLLRIMIEKLAFLGTVSFDEISFEV